MNTEPVRSWMTGRLITITPQTTLPETQRIIECKIQRLPVLKVDRVEKIALHHIEKHNEHQHS